MRQHGWRRVLVLISVGTLAATTLAAPAVGHDQRHDQRFEPRQVGYFTQWGVYGRQFFVKNLDTSGTAARLSHINYAFGNVNEQGRCFESNAPGEGDAWADYQWPVPAEQSVDGVADAWGEPLNGNFGQLLKLKQKYPKLKVLMSLGGWTWSTYFSNGALPENRQAFVASCLDLFIKGNLPVLDGGSGGPGSAAGVFDGIDLDWEWPNWEGEPGNIVRPEDRVNFTALLAEFRRQLDALGRANRKHYELTAFLPANVATIDAGYEVPKVFRSLDFATVQGYDFHGTWESMTNHQSALRPPADSPVQPEDSVVGTVQAYVDRGAPKQKIVVGIPYYGRGWKGVAGGGDGIWQQGTGAAPGKWEAGYEDYKDLIGKVDQGYRLHRDWRDGHAWLFDGTTFWTYDDPLVVLQKSLYIRLSGLGGAMMWSLDGDDSNGTLTRVIHGGLGRRS